MASDRRVARQAAGAGLHIRIVGLFSVIAAVPAMLIGDRRLDHPRSLPQSRLHAGCTRLRLQYRRSGPAVSRERNAAHCCRRRGSPPTISMRKGAVHDESDRLSMTILLHLARQNAGLYRRAVLMDRDGIDRSIASTRLRPSQVVTPEPNDFDDAGKDVPQCLVLDRGHTFVALSRSRVVRQHYLYVARPVDPFAVDFPRRPTV